MDQAETLGIRPVLEMITTHYARGYQTGTQRASICSCSPSPFRVPMEQRRVMLSATHDLTCPVHRLVVVCGSAEDLEALVNKSEAFALECIRVVREPAQEMVQDFEYAKTIVGENP